MSKNLVSLLKYRQLIQSMVVRELKARYRGSVLGFFWLFINPLLLLLVYSFVFAVILPKRSPRTQPYGIFLFCGILPWTWFSSSLLESSNVLIAGANLIKKVLFPAEILPIVTVLANHSGTPGPVLGPSAGEVDSSDIIFDGFYIDSSQNAIAASGGTVQLHRATRCEYRRLYFDQNTVWGSGDNFNMIFGQANFDCVILDCVFQSTGTYATHHNLASIEFYDSTNLTIQYCSFRDVGVGIYAKGEYLDVPGSNSAVIRYNRFTGCNSNAIELGTSASDVGNAAYQNLSYRNQNPGGALRFENSGGGYKNNKFFSNTVQGEGGEAEDEA